MCAEDVGVHCRKSFGFLAERLTKRRPVGVSAPEGTQEVRPGTLFLNGKVAWRFADRRDAIMDIASLRWFYVNGMPLLA